MGEKMALGEEIKGCVHCLHHIYCFIYTMRTHSCNVSNLKINFKNFLSCEFRDAGNLIKDQVSQMYVCVSFAGRYQTEKKEYFEKQLSSITN